MRTRYSSREGASRCHTSPRLRPKLCGRSCTRGAHPCSPVVRSCARADKCRRDGRIYGGEVDEALVAELLVILETKLDVYEKILSKQKYIGGDVRSYVVSWS